MLIVWLEDHPRELVGLVLLIGFLSVNLLVYRYVFLFTHFRPESTGGELAELPWWKRLQRLCAPEPQHRPELTDHPQQHGLSCQTHHLRGSRGRLEGWYLPHPDPTHLVLLFHGYRANKARLLPEARALLEMGCACFLIDFPGSGGSEGEVVSIGYHEALDVVKTLEYARGHWPGLPVVLYGQSMGSVAILRALAVYHPTADAAILECPFNRLLSAVAMRFRNVGLPPFPWAHLFVFWGGLHLGYNGFAHNPEDYARRVTLPVCMLYGAQDQRVRAADLRSVWDRLSGEKELHVFEGVGHESLVTHAPNRWKAIVGRFLQDLAQGEGLRSAPSRSQGITES